MGWVPHPESLGVCEGVGRMGQDFAASAVFLCEDVSEIEFKEGLFYLTDRCGGIEIRRAMLPSTFFRCVSGAYALLCEFQARNGNIAELPGPAH